MIIVLIIFLILVFISAKLYINMKKKDIDDVLNNEVLDGYTVDIPNNTNICYELLKMLNIQDVKVKLNDNKESTTSFYNTFSREITLCDNVNVSKSFARLLFIAHECIHASQKQIQLKFNFILANINLIYCIISIILIWCNVINEQFYLPIFAIALILNMFSFFARNAIESDATYMSIIKAKEYLERYIEREKVELIQREYEKIIHKGYTTFISSLFSTNLGLVLLHIISIIICTYIY